MAEAFDSSGQKLQSSFSCDLSGRDPHTQQRIVDKAFIVLASRPIATVYSWGKNNIKVGFPWEDTFSIMWEQYSGDADFPVIKSGILQSSGNLNQRFFMRSGSVEITVRCKAQKS